MSIRAASLSRADEVRKAAGSWTRFMGSATTCSPMVNARLDLDQRMMVFWRLGF